MCGIAGSINFSPDIPGLTRDLFHRGPDDQQTFTDGPVVLHHHRLAILDIAGGKQPMHRGSLTLIFNGEIYNHQDVRKKLGLTCSTHSDTETILAAYERYGAKCLDEMDGMFALVIYDRARQELFLARDRAGKKPLYYYSDGKRFVFCSELNALQRQVHPSVCETSLQQYMRLGYFFRQATPYRCVYELPAGSYATVRIADPVPVIRKWWSIQDYYCNRTADDFEMALNRTDHYLHAAIRRRVESSDLEVGSFLSGGIDSGIVSAIAKTYNPTLKTFTVSFEGEYDEAPLAGLVARRYQTDHHEIKISYSHLADDVERILANYGEPFMDSSAIPSYYVSREAKKHLTVILNGDGGDELFGGYRRYVPFAQYDFFNPGFFVKGAASFFHFLMPAPAHKKSRYNYLYRLADFARKKNLPAYLSATIDIFDGFEQCLVTEAQALAPVQQEFDLIHESGLSGLQKIMNLDFDNILAGDLLVKMDIATMTHSLEGRSPLLSKELLEYIPSLPDSMKVRGKTTKYLLRRIAEKYLPVELINQPKRGFEIPLRKWVDGQLKELIASCILPAGAYCRNFVTRDFIEKCWNRKIRCGDEKRAKMLWALFALEVWHKKSYLQHA